MSGGNWAKPVVSDTYVSILALLNDKSDDAITLLHSTSAVTNLPTNAKRFNPSSNKFEVWGGASWSDMASTYAINVETVGGYTPGNGSGALPLSNGTVNTNLNADLLDGQHASYFADTGLSNVLASAVLTAVKTVDGAGSGLDADLLDGFQSGNSSGQIPISNGTVNTNLNADKLDGYSEASFAKLADAETVTSAWTFTAATPIAFENGIRVGKNGGGDSVAEFYDDGSNTFRSLFFDTSDSDWSVEDGVGTDRRLIHAGNVSAQVATTVSAAIEGKLVSESDFKGALAYMSAAQNLTSGSYQTLLFGAEDFDTSSIHSVSSNTNRLTVPAGVNYARFTLRLAWEITSATGGIAIIRKNGSAVFDGGSWWDVPDGEYACNYVTHMFPVSAGEYYDFQVFHSTGSDRALDGGSSRFTSVSVEFRR